MKVKLGYGVRQSGNEHRRNERHLIGIRPKLVEQSRVAEELIPVSNMRAFYVSHERHAQLALRYPHATVVKNTMARYLVDAYAQIFKEAELRMPTSKV